LAGLLGSGNADRTKRRRDKHVDARDGSMQPDLIFDIGLHRGLDAKFYLAKGFRVVGVEASPRLCDMVRKESQSEIQSGALTVVEAALHERSNQVVKFFINPEKDDWGSLDQANAEKGVGRSELVYVPTISLNDIISTYGVPYYIKCDIEGVPSFDKHDKWP
jgi:FkbM family methyltransferase